MDVVFFAIIYTHFKSKRHTKTRKIDSVKENVKSEKVKTIITENYSLVNYLVLDSLNTHKVCHLLDLEKK